MGQVTIYLDDELEKRMIANAKSMNLSKSKWIASVISEKLVDEWPITVRELAGAWADFPDVEQIRESEPPDATRESL